MKLIAILALSALCALGQGKPDFTGTWRMNIEKSSFDKQGPPKGATVLKVEHKEPKLAETIFHEPEPKAMGTMEYTTDGSEGSVTAMGNKMKATAKWDGAELVIVTWGSFGPNEMRLTDRWQLSGDGRTLTMLRKYEGQGGPQDQKLVFERAAGR